MPERRQPEVDTFGSRPDGVGHHLREPDRHPAPDLHAHHINTYNGDRNWWTLTGRHSTAPRRPVAPVTEPRTGGDGAAAVDASR